MERDNEIPLAEEAVVEGDSTLEVRMAVVLFFYWGAGYLL